MSCLILKLSNFTPNQQAQGTLPARWLSASRAHRRQQLRRQIRRQATIVVNSGSRREQITAQKTGSNNLHYFATAGLTTTPTSTPAGEVIPPTLRNPGNLYREINLNEFGIVKPSFGEIVIDNLGGVHDDLLSKKLDGQKRHCTRGKKGAEFPGGFTQVLKSSIAGISADYNQIRLKLRDDLDFPNTPLLTKTFTGEGGIKGEQQCNRPAQIASLFNVDVCPGTAD